MMTRTILHEFMKMVLTSLLLCTFLFTLFDFIHKSSNYFAEYEPSAATIARYYLFALPFQLNQTLPIASLIASLALWIVSARNNEVTALRAAGASPHQLAWPFVLGGGILASLSLVLNAWVIPWSSARCYAIKKGEIEGRPVSESESSGQWIRSGAVMLHFGQRSGHQGAEMFVVGPDLVPTATYTARHARYLEEARVWELGSGSEIIWDRDGQLVAVRHFSREQIPFEGDPGVFRRDGRLAEELGFGQLGQLISMGRASGVQVGQLVVAWHAKLALALALLLVPLIGMPLGYRSERSPETVVGVLLAVGIAVLYWFLLSSGRALSLNGDLPVAVGPWLGPAMLVLLVGWRSARLYRVG